MQLNDQVQSYIDSSDWAGLAGYYWSLTGDLSYARPAIFVCLGVLALMVLFSVRSSASSQPIDNAEARKLYQRPVRLPKVGNRGFIDRNTQRWVEPVKFGSVMFETWMKHIAIGSTTGARKTTLIATLIMQSSKPVVLIAGDSSPYAMEAMRARGWRVWSPDGRYGGLFVHEGTPNEAAQIVTVLFKRGPNDTDLQRSMARKVFRDAYQDMDQSGTPRSWPALRKALLQARAPDGLRNSNFEHMRVNWLARIDSLIESLGPGLGDQLSVLDCVNSGVGFAFDLNAFSDLEMASMFGELAVRLTQHTADKAGDFWWIIDELALFNAEMLGQIVRTCRIRLVKFVGASQIISDFGKVLRGLVKVWLVGEQAAADMESRKWCSDITMGLVPPENFAEHATPPGFYYVVADGRTQEIMIQPWSTPKARSPLPVRSSREMQNVAGPQETTRAYQQSPESAFETQAEHALASEDAIKSHPDALSRDDVAGTESVDSVPVAHSENLPVSICPDLALESADGRRIWGKGRAAECRTLGNASVDLAELTRSVRESLRKPHRLWTGGGNGTVANRPKTQARALFGDNKGARTTVTVYIWWFQLISGKDIPSSTPTIDHLCHTYDDSCPGPNPCPVKGCDDPAHPYGLPCQHTSCYEFAHLEAVTLRTNAKRQAEQKLRHAQWMKNKLVSKAA
jgi:hypothetical protein